MVASAAQEKLPNCKKICEMVVVNYQLIKVSAEVSKIHCYIHCMGTMHQYFTIAKLSDTLSVLPRAHPMLIEVHVYSQHIIHTFVHVAPALSQARSSHLLQQMSVHKMDVSEIINSSYRRF
jgi:hypothetical protein